MEMFRRLTSLLLALVMLVSMLPLSAAAEQTEEIITVDTQPETGQETRVESAMQEVSARIAAEDPQAVDETGLVPVATGTFADHTYYLYPANDFTWDEMVDFCREQGGYAAAITTQEENDYLYQLITGAGYKSVYFGLTDQAESRVWQWVSGEPVLYTNWASGEPSSTRENHGMFYSSYTDGKWNDGSFSGGAFLCEIGSTDAELSGTCGTGVSWTFADGVLTISGAGEINANAFANAKAITSVVIEEGITAIRYRAFYNCDGLTEVSIPASVTDTTSNSHGYWFEGCDNLTKITIAEGAVKIPYRAYANLKTDFEIVIPDSVVTIRKQAFDGCSGLKSITLPAGLVTMGEYAFSGCSGLTDVAIPETVETISYRVFYNCDGLTEVTIPASVTGSRTDSSYGCWFDSCDNLTKIIIAEGATQIPNYAFANLVTDFEMAIPETVTAINTGAFSGCTGMKSCVLPDGVTNIGDNVFANCTGLTSVEIPESVTTIRYRAFYNCDGLTEMTIPANITSSGGTGTYDGRWFEGCDNLVKIIIAEGMTKIPHRAFNFVPTDFEITIPETVTEIGSCAFAECMELTGITLPDSITTIGDSAFYSCTSLKEITIPESVATIRYRAFYNCDGLTEITIPANITSSGGTGTYDGRWFEGCDNLVKITIAEGMTKIPHRAFNLLTTDFEIAIPETVTTIGNCAFEGCTGLQDIILPDGITEIGSYAFAGCTGLTKVSLPGGVTTIDDNAYANCTSLTSFEIPESVATIRYHAFYNCDALTEITIPANITSSGGTGAYDGRWFEGCDNLVKITIAEGATIIPHRAFENLTADFEINIPDTVAVISDYAFAGCIGLAEITLPDSVTTIHYNAFANCDSLTEVTIPASVTSSGGTGAYDGRWFEGCDNLSRITVAEGAVKIPYRAFCNLTSAFDVAIPATVTAVSDYAFDGCTGLKNVYYAGTEEQWLDITIGTNNAPLGTAAIYCNSDQASAIPSPLPPVLIAESAGHKTARLDWSYSGRTELVRSFVLYRSEDGSSFSYVRTVDDSARSYTDSPTFTGAEKTYYYKLVIWDVYDRCNESPVITVTLQSADAVVPTAVIGPDQLSYAALGESISLTAQASRDNDRIISYAWSFGDGAAASGKDTAHAYNAAGIYTVTLTVTDASGNTASASQNITVVDVRGENSGYSKLVLNICDAESLAAVSGAQVVISGEEASDTWTVPSGGVLTCVVPNGTYTVSVCANGYIVRTISLTASGGTAEHTIGLYTGSIISGDLTVSEMTHDEIVDAGIDVNSEENQHVYKFSTNLTFVAGPKTYEFPLVVYKNDKDDVVGSGGGGWHQVESPDDGEGSGGMRIFIMPISERFVLIIYGEARWLKEMYKVELVVMNNSGTDTLEQVCAELNLPEGLSLADMTTGQQSLRQEIGSIGHNESESICWYVRGDKEGEYFLSASVSAVTMPYGEIVEHVFEANAPLRVYAGSALHMTIIADDIAERGKEYTVKFRLENVSDKSIYNLSFGLTGSEQYKVIGWGEKEAWLPIESASYGEAFTRTVDELAPGGYVEMELSTTIWFNSVLELIAFTKLGAFVDIAYYLTDVSVVTLEGSTTEIPWSYQINRTEREHIVDKIFNVVLEELFGELLGIELPSGSLGGTTIEIIGESIGLPSYMISGSKTILSLQQGETDHKLVISIDDGTGDGESIYNDVVLITTGTDTEGFFDTVNGTKLKIEAGEVSIQAKGPGSTKVKVGVENSLGKMEREYVYEITVEDKSVSSKLTLSPDGVEGSFKVDEQTLDAAIREKREEESSVYEANPFLWFDSELELEISGQTANSNYSVTMTKEQVDSVLNETATTHVVLNGQAADLEFNREALCTIAQQSGEDITVAARKLSEEELEEAELEGNVYQFAVMTGDFNVVEFGEGTVYVTIPYELPTNADGVYVEHIRADGTMEILDAEYDSETGTVSFSTTGFSYFRIVAEAGRNPFEDVLEGQYYYEPVLWAVENGITNGLSPSTFGVDENCTRAQFVTFLWRAAGCPTPTTSANSFVDVEAGQFYSDAVLWAVEEGITTGLSPTNFGVNEPCSRSQVVTFLWRFAGSPAPAITDNPFTDAENGQFYSTAILWAVENGITTGLDAATFGVNIPCNRAQVVTFLYRAMT